MFPSRLIRILKNNYLPDGHTSHRHETAAPNQGVSLVLVNRAIRDEHFLLNSLQGLVKTTARKIMQKNLLLINQATKG